MSGLLIIGGCFVALLLTAGIARSAWECGRLAGLREAEHLQRRSSEL